MTISIQRARESIGRRVIREEDGETDEGVITYVGRSYVKVLIDGQEEPFVVGVEKLTWKQLLPSYTHRSIRSWEEDETDNWAIDTSDTDQTLIVQTREDEDEDWDDQFVVVSRVASGAVMRAVYPVHPLADPFVKLEIEELMGWAEA